MRRFSFLWAAAYFVSLLLIVTPVVDVTIAALPFQPGEMTWRFAAIGIFAEGVMTPLLGLLFVLLVATHLEHRTVVRVMGGLSALGCAAFLGVLALFALEALEMRSMVPVEAQLGFRMATVAAFLKHVGGAVGTGLLALGARKESARLAPKTGERPGASTIVSAQP